MVVLFRNAGVGDVDAVVGFEVFRREVVQWVGALENRRTFSLGEDAIGCHSICCYLKKAVVPEIIIPNGETPL